jgi:hypothetical protein
MTPDPQIGVSFLTGQAFTTPNPDNENLRMMEDWETPAELIQFIRREKDRLCRQLAVDPSLLGDPTHRLWRIETNAMEACALWHFYRVS